MKRDARCDEGCGVNRRPASPVKTEHEVQRGSVLDVTIGQHVSVLEVLLREDQALLVRRDARLVLDLLLHVIGRVARLDVKLDPLAG